MDTFRRSLNWAAAGAACRELYADFRGTHLETSARLLVIAWEGRERAAMSTTQVLRIEIPNSPSDPNPEPASGRVAGIRDATPGLG